MLSATPFEKDAAAIRPSSCGIRKSAEDDIISILEEIWREFVKLLANFISDAVALRLFD